MYSGNLNVVYWVRRHPRYTSHHLYSFDKTVGFSYVNLDDLKKGCRSFVVNFLKNLQRNRSDISRKELLHIASFGKPTKVFGIAIDSENNDLDDKEYLTELGEEIFKEICE